MGFSFTQVLNRVLNSVAIGDSLNVTVAGGTVVTPIPVVIDMTDILANVTVAQIAKVGASNKTNRVLILITPINGDLHWGFTASVSTSYPMIEEGRTAEFNVSDDVDVYIIAATGTVSTHIAEGSG